MTGTIFNSTMTKNIDAHSQRLGFHEAAPTRDDGADRAASAAGPRLLRVLVVDDCRDAADSLAMLVQIWGHIPRVAYDGTAVLDMIATYQPDVLLLDIAMPGMDGFHLARRLRRETRFRDTLLIALTGYGDKAHRLLWEEAFDHYLVKPVEFLTLEYLLMLEQDRLGPAV